MVRTQPELPEHEVAAMPSPGPFFVSLISQSVTKIGTNTGKNIQSITSSTQKYQSPLR